MTCPSCGRYGPPDPETGYDADELCPACERERDEAAYNEAIDRKRDEDYLFREGKQWPGDDGEKCPF